MTSTQPHSLPQSSPAYPSVGWIVAALLFAMMLLLRSLPAHGHHAPHAEHPHPPCVHHSCPTPNGPAGEAPAGGDHHEHQAPLGHEHCACGCSHHATFLLPSPLCSPPVFIRESEVRLPDPRGALAEAPSFGIDRPPRISVSTHR